MLKKTIGILILLTFLASMVIDELTGLEITIWETLSRGIGGGSGLIFLGVDMLSRKAFLFFGFWQRKIAGFLLIFWGIVFCWFTIQVAWTELAPPL